MTAHRALPVAQLTGFVGREADVRDLSALVSTRRLVTITGEAGVGKSRVAARLLEVLRRSFGGSTARIDHATVGADAFPAAVAAALGAPVGTAADVASVVGDRPFLLLVDDVDDVFAVADFVTELLQHSAETRVLMTARGRTGIRGETPYVLAPLDLPPPSAPQDPIELAMSSETATLLVQRIQEIEPSFRVTPAWLDDMLAVCAATDGIPRFVESAARAVSVVGLREAASALREDPTVLDDFLPRRCEMYSAQQVLAGALDQLAPAAATMLNRLALLQAGCDVRFAAELFSDGRMAAVAAPVGELIERSLVRAETTDGERRLQVPLHYRARLLRAWSGPQRSADEERVRQALLSRLRRCAEAWFSEGQLPAIQFLNRHAADITPLLGSMATDPAHAHEALEIISSLRYYWQLHPVDPWPRARDWLGAALVSAAEQDVVRLRAMQTDAYIAYHEGDLEGATMQLQAIHSTFGPGVAGPPEHQFGIFVRGLVELADGRAEQALPKLVQTLGASLEMGDRDHIGEAYWHVAACQLALGDEGGALGTVQDGLAYCTTADDVWGRGYMGCLLALIENRRGHHEEALSAIRSAIGVMSEFGDRVGLALALRLFSVITGDQQTAGVAGEGVSQPRPPSGGRPPVPLPEFALGAGGWPAPDLPPGRQLGRVVSRIIDGEGSVSVMPERPESGHVLSAREAEVAVLIADGLGNPAIAARLVLSRRTVEGHVQRILAKLGFRSRSQIAVWATQNISPHPAGR